MTSLHHLERTRDDEPPAGYEGSLLDRLVSASPVAVAVVAVASGRVVDANAAFLRLTGFARDEVVGATEAGLGLWPGDDHPVGAAGGLANAAGLREAEVEVRTKAGETRYALLSVATEAATGAPHAVTHLADVTAQKEAEAALAAERDLLRTLMDHLPDAAYVKDAASRFLRLNPAAARALGVTDPAEAVGKTDFFPEALARRYFADEQRVVATGEAFLNRLEPQEEDQESAAWWLTSTFPLRDAEGNVVGLVGCGRDLADRVRAEEALRASEERFRAAFADAPIGMALTTPDGRFVQVNRALGEILGYPEGELLGLTLEAVTHPDDLGVDLEQATRLLSGDVGTYQAEKRYVRADGRVVWGRLSASLVRDGAGRPRYVVAQVQDVTPYKAAGAALRASEARLRSLVANATDLITVLGPDGAIRYEAPAVARVLGHDPEDLVGRDAFGFVHPDDRAALLAEFAALVANPDLRPTVEFRFRHADGSWRWLEGTGTNLLADPAVGGLVVNSRDVTERQAAAAALRESEREARAHQAAAERSGRELALLDTVRTALARELELPELFRTAVEATAGAFGYSQVSLYLREGDELVLQHQVGYDRVLDRIPVATGIAGRVARSGSPALLEDVCADPDFLGAIAGIVSEVCVPLRDGGAVVGVLNLETTDGPPLGPDDLRLMDALAEHVGVAVGRARLYGEARASEARLGEAQAMARVGSWEW